MQPVGFVRTPGVTAVSSPSPRPSPAGRGSHGSTATASQPRRVVQRGPVAPPLPTGEGRGEGERGPVENGPLHFYGSGGLRLDRAFGYGLAAASQTQLSVVNSLIRPAGLLHPRGYQHYRRTPVNRSWPQRTQSNAKRESEFGRFHGRSSFFPAARSYSLFFLPLAFFVPIQLRMSG